MFLRREKCKMDINLGVHSSVYMCHSMYVPMWDVGSYQTLFNLATVGVACTRFSFASSM